MNRITTIYRTNRMINPNEHGIPTGLKYVQTHVEHPRDEDILCGNNIAKHANDHPGNRILREKIEASLDEYHEAKTKQERMKINRRIINFVKENHGSRFLANRNGIWVLMDDQSIRDTVSRTLRLGVQKRQRRQVEIHNTRDHLARMSITSESSDHSSYASLDPQSAADPSQMSDEDMRFQENLARVHRTQLRILEQLLSSDDADDASFAAAGSSSSLSQFDANDSRKPPPSSYFWAISFSE